MPVGEIVSSGHVRLVRRRRRLAKEEQRVERTAEVMYLVATLELMLPLSRRLM